VFGNQNGHPTVLAKNVSHLGPLTVWLKTFFKLSSFVFIRNTGLKLLEFEYMMTEFLFLGELFL